jgi:hypothetical protein
MWVAKEQSALVGSRLEVVQQQQQQQRHRLLQRVSISA